MEPSLSEQLAALDQGRAFVDLSSARVVEVLGPDATTWLDALVTTGVARMAPGEARWSFLLQPTGRVRASFIVVRTTAPAGADPGPDRYLLIQPPGQPKPIDATLAMYRLSSQVTVQPIGDSVFLIGGAAPATLATTWQARISDDSRLSGSATETLAGCPAEDAPRLRAQLLATDRIELQDLLSVMTGLGRAGFPSDLTEDSLPLEAADIPADAIDHAKGCYLGQEAIAKTRNFGRTPFVVVAFRADAPVEVGSLVVSTDGEGDPSEAGQVTSATSDPVTGSSVLMARIRAKADPELLQTDEGVALSPR